MSRHDYIYITMRGDNICGLVVQGTEATATSYLATGDIEINGTCVKYKNVRLGDDWIIDYSFDVNEYGMELHISKNISRPIHACEFDDIRFSWGVEKSIF